MCRRPRRRVITTDLLAKASNSTAIRCLIARKSRLEFHMLRCGRHSHSGRRAALPDAKKRASDRARTTTRAMRVEIIGGDFYARGQDDVASRCWNRRSALRKRARRVTRLREPAARRFGRGLSLISVVSMTRLRSAYESASCESAIRGTSIRTERSRRNEDRGIAEPGCMIS